MTVLGACSKKTVEPVPQPKPAAVETPAAPSPSIYGAPASADTTAPLSSSVTTAAPTTPEAPELVSDKQHKAATASKSHGTTSHKAAAAPAHGKKYVVKKGDTLSGIAKKTYGSTSDKTINKILAANPGLKKNLIKVGQTIILP